MCGFTGVFAFNEEGRKYHAAISQALAALSLRGPDSDGIYRHNNVCLGHKRLSIIDTSDAAAQPFSDETGRYTVVFNGEFYNFKEQRLILKQKGYTFKSESDTEVLLKLFIDEGPGFVNKMNGFFAFAIYDKLNESLFISRDRYGIKPLYIYTGEDALIFGSEMKSLLGFGIPRQMDMASLYSFLQLNYMPPNCSIFENVSKLEPGTSLIIKQEQISKERYYNFPYPNDFSVGMNYEEAQKKLRELVYDAVKMRLIADVPLGTFLSGGIDSSVISAVAASYTSNLNTFSIGFKDEPMFDETYYANLVARKLKTTHTVFSLSNDDLLEHLYEVLDYIDEPFADSSALAVYILSKHTRKHVTVALSGDGADEMFAGYNKHHAEFIMQKYKMALGMMRLFKPILSLLPQSRQSPLNNTFRQINRMLDGAALSRKERYWRWAGLSSEKHASQLLVDNFDMQKYQSCKNDSLRFIDNSGSSLNDILATDMHLVLTGDMLTKVDMMSMANSLEVRVPFLDYRLVQFAFELPVAFKIDKNGRKKILKDAFKNELPDELYNRKKHGFEVPLLKWFRKELKDKILNDWLAEDFIAEQNIFSNTEINSLKAKLFSTNPQDAHAKIWGLIVFQHWYKKYML